MRHALSALSLVVLAAACAGGAGRAGVVRLAPPEPAHGDDQTVAWPFVVTHEGGGEIVADFHLRIEEGGTLLGVRPDSDNPDPDASIQWRGEVRGGEGYWIGDVLSKGASVRLWALIRPTPGQEPRLKVVHWPTDGRDNPAAEQACEIWRYDPGGPDVEQEAC